MGWASEELETIDLGDARLNRRAAMLAEAFADSPTASIPRSSEGLAERKAACRLFDHEKIDFRSVLEPYTRVTGQRMSKHRVALCPQDTTSPNFDGQDIEGLGPLSYEAERGLLVHPTYVVTPGQQAAGADRCVEPGPRVQGRLFERVVRHEGARSARGAPRRPS